MGILLFLSFLIVGCSNEDHVLEGVTMTIKEGTLTKVSATVVINDTTGNDNIYGEDFSIQKKGWFGWHELQAKESFFLLVGYLVDENGKLELECDWEEIYGELKPGTYRLVKEGSPRGSEKKYIYAEFVIA